MEGLHFAMRLFTQLGNSNYGEKLAHKRDEINVMTQISYSTFEDYPDRFLSVS